ncbi:putative odorant receptor 85d [Venturia canescens]|uniref:putative odorant receptor 85d n=1 Tax=Venturia canescens TaxID=32260 RepID=UPI001C9CF6E9|nr:putative odorant receptor 85d [Venturia canescens]
MEKSAYFESVNRLNVFVNFLAGHFLPLSDDLKKLDFLSILWMMFAWSIKIVYLTSCALGTLHFANLTADQAFKKSGAIAVLTTEILIPLFYLNIRRSDLHILIKNYNLILIECDDLRECVCQTVKHYNAGLSFYLVAGLLAAILFPAAPIFRIFESEQFTYADFTLPAYLPGEPFGRGVFAAGVAIQVVGGCAIHVGAIAIYLYVIHYIAVLVGQYKYVRIRIAEALSEKDGRRDDLSVITALRDCVEHHSAVIKVGQRLIEVLAFHIGVTYITCIMEFCFLAYGVITFENAVVEKFTYIAYIFCRILLVFMLCSSIQELVDASTSVTDDAFHENWYTRSMTVQKTFYIIQLSNQIECRISAYRIVDLVVPTLALILSKSYSVCLLLLNVN